MDRINKMIDLHTHSTASDGTLTPAELVRHARDRGVEVLSLTDHDTLSGLAEAIGEAERLGMDFVPGIEISAEFEPGTLHILGYYLNPSDKALEDKLTWLREGRDNRNDVILGKLTSLGHPLTMEDVLVFAQGESVGRPHIADAMVAKGYVVDKEQAFDMYLAKGGPAYADKERMSAGNAISLIRNAGGLAVLAHPQWLGLDRSALSSFVHDLREMGLAGLEAYYYSHSPDDTRFYVTLAKEHGMLVTGGTDFHGPGGLKGTEIGKGTGRMNVPREIADQLREAWEVTRSA